MPILAPTTMSPTKIPIILLKTKSTPNDGYEEYFRSVQAAGGVGFEPAFVPVLEHRYNRENLERVARLLRDGGEGVGTGYGGLIFTSQRAVEGFISVVASGRGGGTTTAFLTTTRFPPYRGGLFFSYSTCTELPAN
jgi:uroporphyrinogen-III synthase